MTRHKTKEFAIIELPLRDGITVVELIMAKNLREAKRKAAIWVRTRSVDAIVAESRVTLTPQLEDNNA